MRYYSLYFCYYHNHKASNGEVWNDVQMSITAADEKLEDCCGSEFGVEQYSRDKGLVSLEFDNFADLLTKAREFTVGPEVLELSGLTENEEALIREFCLKPEEDEEEDEFDEDEGVKELLDEIDESLSNNYKVLEGDSDTLYVKRRGTDVHYSIHVSECYD